MPVELRKRPAPKEESAPAAKRSASKPRTTSKAKAVLDKAKAVVTGEPATATPAVPDSETAGDSGKIPETVGAGTAGTEPTTTAAGEQKVEEPPATTTTTTTAAAIPAATPGEATTPLSQASISKPLPTQALTIQTTTHTGHSTPLSTLLSQSTSGLVIFTYPKASTPGCTTQACLFRDNYDDIKAKGYNVYGLSADSEKANAGFKGKQGLQFDMLCDPEAKLTGMIGMKKPGPGKGTLRGVVVLAKDGLVKGWFQGGPAKTLEAAREVIGL